MKDGRGFTLGKSDIRLFIRSVNDKNLTKPINMFFAVFAAPKGRESIAQALAWVRVFLAPALKGRQKIVLRDVVGFSDPEAIK